MIAAMDPTTFQGFLIAAVTTLAGWIAIAVKSSNAKHDKCELDKDALESRMSTMESDMSVFKSCPHEPCGAREAFDRRASFSVKK